MAEPQKSAASAVGRPFQKGVSGNPGGRPKGLAKTVRQHTGQNGAKLAQGFALIAWGKPEERTKFFGEAVEVNTKNRLAAMSELANRGFGRVIEAEPGDPAGTTLIFNIPRPAAEMAGHQVVRAAIEVKG